jgi:hypothetical protein
MALTMSNTQAAAAAATTQLSISALKQKSSSFLLKIHKHKASDTSKVGNLQEHTHLSDISCRRLTNQTHNALHARSYKMVQSTRWVKQEQLAAVLLPTATCHHPFKTGSL